MKTQWLACLALALGACPSVDVDQDEGNIGPTVEFDPANKIIPFPNNLLLDPMTGKLALPETCNESAATALTRTAALNKLDGFGTYEAVINVTFTEPFDMASLAGNVLVYQRTDEGVATDPLTAQPIPDAGLVLIPNKTVRFANQTDIKACTDPVMVDQLTIVSRAPLAQKSIYTVAIKQGVKTAGGAEFQPSSTWAIVRQPEPVVAFDAAGNVTLNRTPLDPREAEGIAQLQGIDLLWKAHHDAITFLAGAGNDSEELLLAFEFKTQTITDPLDPAQSGTPAAQVSAATPLIGNLNPAVDAPSGPAVINHLGPFAPCGTDSPVPNDTQCFLRVLLGGGNPNVNVNYAIGKATCAAAGCDNIGTVLNSLLLSKQYQQDVTNTLYTGTGTLPIPSAWADPIRPAVVHDTTNPNPLANDVQAQIGVLVLLPTSAPPAGGYPTVIFQHGITRSLGDVFGIAGALTKTGFAVVAIDAALHGSRAVRISNAPNADPKKDCSDVTGAPLGDRADLGPNPADHGTCYAPVFSTDLAGTRDGFRQTLVDQQQLLASLQACGTTNCNELQVDPTRILYLGHSMGSIFGGMTHAMTTDIKASVLNVSGAGWADILINTDQVAGFQCPLVDGLIDAGVLTGDKFDEAANTGLCTTDAWKTDPGFLQFAAIARWILDPADPANFMTRLAPKKFLIQRAAGDAVVPNIATDNEGALVGQMRVDGGDANGCPTPTANGVLPSVALAAAPTTSHFLNYNTIAPTGAGTCPIGATYSHSAMLKPEPSAAGGSCALPNPANCDGVFATAQLQADVITFLLANK